MNKCPCKECISFAICYNNRSIECTDLMYYLYDNKSKFIWNEHQVNEVEVLFKKRVDHIIGALNVTVFKQKRLNI